MEVIGISNFRVLGKMERRAESLYLKE